MTIAEKIADFCLSTGFEDLPSAVIATVKSAFADYIGIACLGAQNKASDAVADYIRLVNGTEQGLCIRKQMMAPMELAGLINAQMGHMDDFDDSGIPGHTSAILGGICVALKDYCNLSGKDMIRGYALGMEVEFRVGQVLMDSLVQHGFTCTPVFGCIGAVVTAACLLKLNREEFVNAIAIVVSDTGGVPVNFGSDCKPYQVGLAAAAGIRSSLAAKAGLNGRPDAIEGKGGYAQLYCGKTIDGNAIDFSKDKWLVAQSGIVIKQYPCCLGNQGAAVGLFSLMDSGEIDPDEIAHIDVGLCYLANASLTFTEPVNVTEARFSVNFVLANIMLKRYLGLKSFDQRVVDDPEIREKMKIVSRQHHPELKDVYADETMPTILTITLKDGSEKRFDSRLPKFCEGANFAVLNEQIRKKFNDCTADFIDEKTSNDLFERLMNLEKDQSLEWLTQAFIG